MVKTSPNLETKISKKQNSNSLSTFFTNINLFKYKAFRVQKAETSQLNLKGVFSKQLKRLRFCYT